MSDTEPVGSTARVRLVGVLMKQLKEVLPRLDEETAQGWINDPERLKKFLEGLYSPEAKAAARQRLE